MAKGPTMVNRKSNEENEHLVLYTDSPRESRHVSSGHEGGGVGVEGEGTACCSPPLQHARAASSEACVRAYGARSDTMAGRTHGVGTSQVRAAPCIMPFLGALFVSSYGVIACSPQAY